jgi:hypothetical protein
VRVLLSLDLSTTCTGWAVFDVDQNKLITYGTLKPSIKGLSKLKYPKQQLTKMIDLAFKVRGLIENYKPTYIVIEEVAGSKQRIGQKVLDGLHWIVLMHIREFIDIVYFYDVTGVDGWRTHLNLRLSEQDKINNKEAKKLNKEIGKDIMPIFDAKDVGDAVSMGSSFIKFKCPRQ